MTADDPLLKTRQVAAALGVSGSTIKRWVDAGVLGATRTVGRHRLIRLSEALRFARQQGLSRSGLEAMGGSGAVGAVDDRLRDLLTEALRRGDAGRAKALIQAVVTAGGAVVLADWVVRPVMERIGHGWMVGAIDVFHEHQASQIVAAALGGLIDRAAQGWQNPSPLALGATPEGDPYQLSLLLGELVLREAGWDVRNLGTNLPLRSLAGAVLEYRPGLVFLSVNHLADEGRFAREYLTFYEAAAAAGAAVVVGGRALGPDLRARLAYTGFGERMADLAEFVRRLAPADPGGGD